MAADVFELRSAPAVVLVVDLETVEAASTREGDEALLSDLRVNPQKQDILKFRTARKKTFKKHIIKVCVSKLLLPVSQDHCA